MRVAAVVQLILLALLAFGCTSSPRFVIRQEAEAATSPSSFIQDGIASYYAEEFHGRKTSNGETYDMNDLTAAHQTLPFGTIVKVTNKSTGRSVIVRINDRGPFLKDRIIDLSRGAAEKIGMIGPGSAEVHLEVLEWGTGNYPLNP
jgi:rare lipoprotein A